MTKKFWDSQPDLKQLIREEEDKAVATLVNKLRGMTQRERVLQLIDLIQQARRNQDLVPVISKAVKRGFLIELQEAEQELRAKVLRQRPQVPQVPQKPIVKPSISPEELRRRLSKTFRVKNPLNGDRDFVTKVLMPKFRIKQLRVEFSPSKAKWPDIWVELKPGAPVITVTQEWMRQSQDERRKRLVHEFLHLKGMSHGRKNGLNYNTKPELDTYSMSVYKSITRGSK